MKQSLQLRIGQSLTMTPQLQQAIKLLQLSTLELQSEIQEALESNPMLEVEESSPDSNSDSKINGQEHSSESTDNHSSGTEAADAVELNQQKDNLPDELPVDTAWEDIYDIPPPPSSGTNTASSDNRDFFENQSIEDDGLISHLLWQLQCTPMSETDNAIGLMIIDAINEDGYLTESCDQLLQGLRQDPEQHDIDSEAVGAEEINAVLHLIQRFDPPGVAARDLKECLSLQLDLIDDHSAQVKSARDLIENHLELLGLHDYVKLKRLTRLNEQDLHAAVLLIQSLNPKPGAYLSANKAEYIVPDVFVKKIKNRWSVELNNENTPKLRINPLYASFVKNRDSSDENTYLKNNLQEARWFLKSLLSRNETLLRVATAIVEKQRTFFDYGEEGMKPLVLREIAEQLELHESTISRVTTQKFMHTPNGIFEFKYFFSSHVGTADGGECSATAIRAMIKKMIENESPMKPLSDNKLAAMLVDKGINVARRTVAKYREAMVIPPSNERKRLA
ncbi:MAG: RNA polymerase factor sigma-54 [Gammaproteobacteria bacterium]|nr:RNA polymerase factor sigma-54 [Gammaproteobacteria bacterium]